MAQSVMGESEDKKCCKVKCTTKRKEEEPNHQSFRFDRVEQLKRRQRHGERKTRLIQLEDLQRELPCGDFKLIPHCLVRILNTQIDTQTQHAL